MKNIGLRNALWRSRAVAIIGFLIMLLAIFGGLPSALKSTLFIIFGLLTMAFGFAGSRHKSYSELEDISSKEVSSILETEQIFPVVEPENQVPMITEND